jgi:hypothetical protein
MAVNAIFRNLTVGLDRALSRLRPGRPSEKPGRAPGHRHTGPDPEQHRPVTPDTEPRSNQPWIRRSHSDSQRRRFRR